MPRNPLCGALPRRAARGVTAIESLVVVAILAILLGITAPSFRSFIESQELKSMAYDLTTDLLLARSEALKRNRSVEVRAGSLGWQGGWAVSTVTPAEELRRRTARSLSVAVSEAPTAITFASNGRVVTPGNDVRFSLSSPGNAGGRCVDLDLSGRARSQVGACT